MTSARIAGISRLRVNTDGPGIRTLVPLSGCHLGCAYCLNEELRSEGAGELQEPETLLEKVRKDDIYFRASGGGITFGGGEPLLHSEFIRLFAQICPDVWTIAVETSLNVPEEDVERLLGVVDLWIVDIKDMKPDIYRKYTGRSNEAVIANLITLRNHCGCSQVLVRIPFIPEVNEPEDMENSARVIRSIGFQYDFFDYNVPPWKRLGNEILMGDFEPDDDKEDETVGSSGDSPLPKSFWDRIQNDMTLGIFDINETEDDDGKD